MCISYVTAGVRARKPLLLLPPQRIMLLSCGRNTGSPWARITPTACLLVTPCRYSSVQMLQEVVEFPDGLVRGAPGPILVPESSELQVGCGKTTVSLTRFITCTACHNGPSGSATGSQAEAPARVPGN